MPYHYNEKTYIKLYITMKDKEIAEERVKREILTLCKKNLIKYSVPRVIEIVEEMPRTKLGKIDFKKLELENN